MKSHFGKQLKAAREAKGYTQQALGKLIGIDGNSVARLERGANPVKWGNLEKIVEILGEPATFYFSDDMPPATKPPPSRSTLIGEIVIGLSRLKESQLQGVLGAIELAANAPSMHRENLKKKSR